jgi:hypothetical protein
MPTEVCRNQRGVSRALIGRSIRKGPLPAGDIDARERWHGHCFIPPFALLLMSLSLS